MVVVVRLMDKILHDPKDPKLWELWYIPYNDNAGFCPSAVVVVPGVVLLDLRSLGLALRSRAF